jgi:hypothetical protein
MFDRNVVMMIIRVLSLILIVSSISANDPPRTNEWPFSEYETSWRGYGQWNSEAGFHWALDLHGLPGDITIGNGLRALCGICSMEG